MPDVISFKLVISVVFGLPANDVSLGFGPTVFCHTGLGLENACRSGLALRGRAFPGPIQSQPDTAFEHI